MFAINKPPMHKGEGREGEKEREESRRGRGRESERPKQCSPSGMKHTAPFLHSPLPTTLWKLTQAVHPGAL